ncbi:MAG: hypothetical protein LPK47_03835 [Bacteroidota bacterium]|nr:hypothetical protein [Bacteroidota bacterium]MDX5447488.1 hypothetical protein [Bacteroidota bacterium]
MAKIKRLERMNVPGKRLKFSQSRNSRNEISHAAHWIMLGSVLLFILHQLVQAWGWSHPKISSYLDPILFIPVFTQIEIWGFGVLKRQWPFDLLSFKVLILEALVATILFEGILPRFNPHLVMDIWDSVGYFIGALALGFAAGPFRREYSPSRRV